MREALQADQIPAGPSRRALRGREAALVAIVVVGLGLVAILSRWLDGHRPAENQFASYEENYISGEAARNMSLSFNGLVADWYWLRALQYVGRKVAAHRGTISIDDLRPVGVTNLGPLLEKATTLDPKFMAAYEYGAIVLPAIDPDAAVRLTEKGIRANPNDWRLYQHLGYIRWQQARFQEASQAYRTGASLAGAPAWMNAMAAQMEVGGGSREVARDIYRRMLDEAKDEQIRELAARRLLQLISLDQRDMIRSVLSDARTRDGACASSWRDVTAQLRAKNLKVDQAGSPLDPLDVPYVLDSVACDVRLNEKSEIPKK